MPEPVLQARDIHTYYGDSYVIQGVDLDLIEGRTLALLGRNGMGKTTLIRSLMNLTTPKQGEVKYRGKVVSGLHPNRVARHGIALVPQGRRIFPTLTVQENLALPGSVLAGRGMNGAAAWTQQRVYTLFPRLQERAGQMAGSLSGGEQSMLAFGRALMCNPDVILMDEPTEGLAPVIVARIGEVIEELKKSGLTILLVEQNARFAENVADDVSILSNGKIVFHGTPEALDDDPDTRQRWLGI
ncbi:MAG: ABC transporter ATP-binding protein [Pseudomonadota bacterium]